MGGQGCVLPFREGQTVGVEPEMVCDDLNNIGIVFIGINAEGFASKCGAPVFQTGKVINADGAAIYVCERGAEGETIIAKPRCVSANGLTVLSAHETHNGDLIAEGGEQFSQAHNPGWGHMEQALKGKQPMRLGF